MATRNTSADRKNRTCQTRIGSPQNRANQLTRRPRCAGVSAVIDESRKGGTGPARARPVPRDGSEVLELGPHLRPILDRLLLGRAADLDLAFLDLVHDVALVEPVLEHIGHLRVVLV